MKQSCFIFLHPSSLTLHPSSLPMSLSLSTPVLELSKQGIARLGAPTARKLALALASASDKRDASEATVEDLLNYLPMRYEDRSNLARIADLSDGTEASLELYVRVAGGEILLLGGALGAGKTVFVKGLAAALGVDPDEVSSPSFTLVNRYDEGRLTLYHLDLYRLAEGPGAAHAVELEELLSDERAVIVIEWAERMGRYRLPPSTFRVHIDGDGEDPRRIRITHAADPEG